MKRGMRVMHTRTSAGGWPWARLRSLRWREDARIASARSLSIFGGLRRCGTDAFMNSPPQVSLETDAAPAASIRSSYVHIVKNGNGCQYSVFLSCGFSEKRLIQQQVASGRQKEGVHPLTVDWIRAGLKHTGKTRSGLAKALGRSPSAVTDLLNGHRRLRADEIATVSEYLGIEPPRLIGG